MKAKLHNQGKQGGMSKGKMFLGAAGLLLFIIGVRRTFRTEGGEIEDLPLPEDQEEGEDEEGDFDG